MITNSVYTSIIRFMVGIIV